MNIMSDECLWQAELLYPAPCCKQAQVTGSVLDHTQQMHCALTDRGKISRVPWFPQEVLWDASA